MRLRSPLVDSSRLPLVFNYSRSHSNRTFFYPKASTAGVRDTEKAKSTLPGNNTDLQIVKADVTEGSTKLAEAISDDYEAVICAAGFQPSWDLTAPWKVDHFGIVNLVEACQKRGVSG